MIERDPQKAAQTAYDLVIVGGGIYGVALAMESARRGLRPLLLERDDFGSATSWNSLGILHGGLRYLQTLDLHRFRESVSERTWFCQHFPELVKPLECMMPLYGRGLKRPSVFSVALRANDYLSRHRNDHVRADRRLPDGRVLDAEETKLRFPAVATQGLRGAGVWWDVAMERAPRVLMEMLRWACANGAVALNYVSVEKLLQQAGQVRGVCAVERIAGGMLEFTAPVVVNCAGPWSRALAAVFDRDDEAIFRPSLAFNILLDRDPLSECALAVTPNRAGAPTYFMVPRRRRILAGTYHAPWQEGTNFAAASEQLIENFLSDLSEAVPGFEVGRDDVARVYPGLQPAKAGRLDLPADRAVIKNHAAASGPEGLFTVSGVKFTTARLVAIKALKAAFGKSRDLSVRPNARLPEPRLNLAFSEDDLLAADPRQTVADAVRGIISTESVVTMEDLLLRRVDCGHDPRHFHTIAERVRAVVGWAGDTAPPKNSDELVVPG